MRVGGYGEVTSRILVQRLSLIEMHQSQMGQRDALCSIFAGGSIPIDGQVVAQRC
jgi:hypothetical protein